MRVLPLKDLAAGGNDLIDGGAGSDTVVLSRSRSETTGVTVNLTTGVSAGDGNDKLVGIENIDARVDQGNTLIGNAADNTFTSGNGNDVEQGLGGDDTFYRVRRRRQHRRRRRPTRSRTRRSSCPAACSSTWPSGSGGQRHRHA